MPETVCYRAAEYLVSWDSSDASTGTASPDRNVTGTGSHRRRGQASDGWGRGSGRGSVWAGGRYWVGSGCGGTRWRTGGSHPGGGGNLKI